MLTLKRNPDADQEESYLVDFEGLAQTRRLATQNKNRRD